jgi:hypothetical protein
MSVGGGFFDVAKLPGVLVQVGEVAAPIYLVVTAMCVDTFLTGWQAMPVEEQSHFPATCLFLVRTCPHGMYAKVSVQMPQRHRSTC